MSTQVHDAASMRAAEERAIAAGSSGPELMLAAGTAAAFEIRARYPGARRIAVLCGSGGNGGDGCVVAYRLAERGREVRIATVGRSEPSSEVAWAHDLANVEGVSFLTGEEGLADALDGAELVIDAMLGIGATGEPKKRVARAIVMAGELGVPMVSLDVPSGVDASSGECADTAVHAELTVTFGAPKLGLLVEPGRSHVGELVVAGVGIDPADGIAEVVGAESRELLPSLSPSGSKYDRGTVLVVAGSPGMAGAAILAGRAAQRAGAGMVRICVDERAAEAVARNVLEQLVVALPHDPKEAARAVAELAGRAEAIVLGPGLGRDAGRSRLVERLLEIELPFVLDADGLFALGERPERLARRSSTTVLTPHAGEAARLLGTSSSDVGLHRLRSVRQLAERSGQVTLLKGSDTLVASPGGRLSIRAGGGEALATAGTGDVLSGIIGALLARGLAGHEAAIVGAWIHAEAATDALAQAPGRVVVAGDLIDALRAR